MNILDIIGPVMIGPSSSHTAGAARIGLIARTILGQDAVKAEIQLHGSFAKTYRGHGTDKALVAGIMGMLPDDAQLPNSLILAKARNLIINISCIELENAHPNTAVLILTDETGRSISMQGASVGGGSVMITRVNGMPVEISGQYTTFIILHKDAPGTIASVTEEMRQLGVNICNFRLARNHKGGEAVMSIELDSLLTLDANQRFEALPNVISSTMLLPI